MKPLILQKYNQLSILFTLTILAGMLLMFRIKLTQSFYLIFLVWNVFLAAIPYGITFFVLLHKERFTHKGMQLTIFLIWLVFLPNAPYIVSDFTHLHWTDPRALFLDAAIISSFALLGILYMVYSIRDMQHLFLYTLSRKQNLLFTICICLLIGFGIYLGRYLRWNSWDIMQNPLDLIEDIGNLIFHPIRNKFAWRVTLSYATLSGLAITIINRLKWAH